ncbi:MAG: hypothetical protein ACT6FF_07415 [Methanosarcinaceae archaeon]
MYYKKLVAEQQQLARQAEQQYSFEVEAILQDKCRDPRRIECLLDGILVFVSMMGCCVYIKSSAAIISKSTPWQPLRMSTHIVKCGMRKKILNIIRIHN